MSVSSAPARLSRVGGRNLKLSVAAGVVVAGATAGLLLGGAFGGDADVPALRHLKTPTTIAHGGLRVQAPSGWERADVEVVPGFRRPLGLRTTGGTLRATVELLPATSATLIPAPLRSTLASAPERGEVVRLASGRQAWRYRLTRPDGSTTLLYAAPTTAGIATVACAGTTGTSTTRCDELARTLTVPGSRALEPGTSAAFYSRLPATVNELDAARTQGARDLSAATRSTRQAIAANGLARAHKTAGAALAPLISEGDSLPTATVEALGATASVYATLASAARARSPRAYADAANAVSAAEADLRREMTNVAAAASAASRRATTAASTPAARSKPATPASTPAARSKPPAAAPPTTAKPVAAAPQGTDLTLVVLMLAGAFAIFLAVRATIRATR